MPTEEILRRLGELKCRKVTITGGEPLIHGAAFGDLLHSLVDRGYIVSVETNGSRSVPLDLIGLSTVNWVFDYKLPGSGMNHMNMAPSLWRSIPHGSWVKYVIIDWTDFAEAAKHSSGLLESRPDVKIAFSACLGYPEAISPDDIIAACIDAEFFHVVFNLQIHKFIFPKGENISKTN
jgi:7-carboxy-7-deazaguanine synthase